MFVKDNLIVYNNNLVYIKMNNQVWITYTVLGLIFISGANCLRRCYLCRSRGELGSCGDPFIYNETGPGIKVETCQSGWCAKMIEGSSGVFRTDDYGVATHRMCLKEGPSDGEERCGQAMIKSKKVFMCFCNSDLCNSAIKASTSSVTLLLSVLISLLIFYSHN